MPTTIGTLNYGDVACLGRRGGLQMVGCASLLYVAITRGCLPGFGCLCAAVDDICHNSDAKRPGV